MGKFSNSRRSVAALAVLAAVTLSTGFGAATAQAAPVPPTGPKGGSNATATAQATDTTCKTYSDGTGDICFWFHDHAFGSRVGLYTDDSDMSDNFFKTVGDGQGQRLANNAEFYFNYDDHYAARLYTGPNYTGSMLYVPPNDIGTLPAGFLDNVESVKWVFVS